MKSIHKIPWLLLAGAYLLSGAKSPLAFCAWTLPALAFSMAVILRKLPPWRQITYFLIWVAGILLAQTFSLDPANSLFWSAQYLVFSCVWLALEALPPDDSADPFWWTLMGLGACTCLQTTFQWVSHTPLYGALPLNPNFDAVWMAALAVALLSMPGRKMASRLLVVWLSALVILGQSRSGLLALAAGFLYAVGPRHSWRYLFGGLGLVVLSTLLLPHDWWTIRLNVLEPGARLRIWGIALRGLADYPLTGYGLGNFEIAYHQYAFPTEEAIRYGRETAFTHNDYLQNFSELGWPLGGLLLTGFCGLLWRRPDSDSRFHKPAKAILIVLGLAACFNTLFRMPILAYLALLASSYLRSRPSAEQRAASPDKNSVRAGLLLLMTCVSVLMAVCGMRSYWTLHRRWDRIAAWDPHNGEAWHGLAYAAQDNGDALNYHRKAALVSPHQLYYVEALARALESSQDPKLLPQALQAYLKTIQLAPARATSYLSIGRLLWRAGEPAKAMPWIDQASALEPHYWECDLWKARWFDNQGDKKRAAFILNHLIRRRQEFLKLYPGPPSSAYEATILNYDDATVRSAQSAFRHRP